VGAPWDVPDAALGVLPHDGGMTTHTLLRPIRTAAATTAKGWHLDPRGEHKLRFHDGSAWTEHTTHHGPVPCAGCGRWGSQSQACLSTRSRQSCNAVFEFEQP